MHNLVYICSTLRKNPRKKKTKTNQPTNLGLTEAFAMISILLLQIKFGLSGNIKEIRKQINEEFDLHQWKEETRQQ